MDAADKPSSDLLDEDRHEKPVQDYLHLLETIIKFYPKDAKFSVVSPGIELNGVRCGLSDEQVEAYRQHIADVHARLNEVIANLAASISVRLRGRADHPLHVLLGELGGRVKVGRETDTPPDHVVCRLLWERIKLHLALPLNGVVGRDGQGVASRPARDAERSTFTPLSGWHAIIQVVNRFRSPSDLLRRDRSSKDALRKLSDKHSGPIRFGAKGQRPKVGLEELENWLDGLKEHYQQTEEQGSRVAGERKAATDNVHPHGRSGVVAPDIGGQVKHRRSPEKFPKGPQVP